MRSARTAHHSCKTLPLSSHLSPSSPFRPPGISFFRFCPRRRRPRRRRFGMCICLLCPCLTETRPSASSRCRVA
ncbi:hypothetical protein CC86DRAFT_144667 [Ophiobolus disseminans]|uniref:Uncharacterized protein n=1 Tax=Ophiobolus disseminans TaxID=1469910 RepID=A0A6A6ZEN1_9PLEO|nr:hypothetical protein CC86DRAFT_144667 [Ophiobolus disseminans]